jgi:hypothetical protein
MLLRRRRPDHDEDPHVIVEPGTSLAKGPALIAGSILVAFGLASLLKNSDFPTVSSSFPDGTVQGTNFLGIEVNGWTAFFSIAAGALLMFGAAQHHLAKFMSLLVGLALAACAVIAIIDGDDVLGLAAANTWTKVAFAVAGGAMLVNALMPRTTRRRRAEPAVAVDPAPSDEAPTVVGGRRPAEDAPTSVREPAPAAEAEAPTTVHRRGRFLRGRDRTGDTDADADQTTVSDRR